MSMAGCHLSSPNQSSYQAVSAIFLGNVVSILATYSCAILKQIPEVFFYSGACDEKLRNFDFEHL
jgi:hypothetical protein